MTHHWMSLSRCVCIVPTTLFGRARQTQPSLSRFKSVPLGRFCVFQSMHFVFRCGIGAASILALALLCGAPIGSAATWRWLALQIALAVPSLALALRSWTEVFTVGIWPERWLSESPLLLPAAASLLGSWLGAVVIPLDWGQSWQAWPTGSSYGCIVGFLLGGIGTAIVTTVARLQRRDSSHPHAHVNNISRF
jgi:hypothetical protein